MTSDDVMRFLADNVPGRCSMDSALMEFAAVQRGLDVERVDESLIFLQLGSVALPFFGIHGPKTSYVARRLLELEKAWPVIARHSSLPMPPNGALANGELIHAVVLGERVVSATRIVRASVVGDGASTVAALIQQENETRECHVYLENHLLPTDPEALDGLSAVGRQLDSVPGDGEQVMLELQPGATGGFVDVTDSLDVAVRDLAVTAVGLVPGLPYGGVEIILPEHGAPAVLDVRYSPALMAHFPTTGEPRDVAGAIVDYYLTEAGNPATQGLRRSRSGGVQGATVG